MISEKGVMKKSERKVIVEEEESMNESSFRKGKY